MNFGQVTLQLLEGFGTTVLVFALTLAMALPLGLTVVFGSMTKFKPLRWLYENDSLDHQGYAPDAPGYWFLCSGLVVRRKLHHKGLTA